MRARGCWSGRGRVWRRRGWGWKASNSSRPIFWNGRLPRGNLIWSPAISSWIASRQSNWKGWWDVWRGRQSRRRDGYCRTFASRQRDWVNGGRGLFWRQCICFSDGPPACLRTDSPRRTHRWCDVVLSFDNGICSSGDFYTLICGKGNKLTTWVMGFFPVLRGPLFLRQQDRNAAQSHCLSVLGEPDIAGFSIHPPATLFSPVPSIHGKQLGGGASPGKRNKGHFDLIRLFEDRFHYDVGRTLQ